MTEFNFYHSLSKESKEVLKSLAPKGWKPPPDSWNKKLEDLDEIAKIMKRKPENVDWSDKW